MATKKPVYGPPVPPREKFTGPGAGTTSSQSKIPQNRFSGPSAGSTSSQSLLPGTQFNPNGSTGSAIPVQDPLTAALAALYGGPTPDFSSGGASVAGAFAPVLADLNSQKGAATSRSKQDDAQLAAMYAALQKNIGANGSNIDRNTAQQVGVDTNIANMGKQSVDNAYNGANSNVSQLLANLGLQQAAPNALQKADNGHALITSIMDANHQNQAGLANQLGANAHQFNTEQAAMAGFAGNDARASNSRHLQDILQGIGTQQAQVKSQQGQAALSASQAMQSQYIASLQNQANNLFQSFAARQTQDNADRQYGLDTAKLGLEQQKIGMTNLSPGDQAYSRAAQLFGSQGDAASRAINLIMQAGAGKVPASPMEFSQMVLKANHAQAATHPGSQLADDALQNLAMTLYQQMKLKPEVPNYLSQYAQ